MFIIALFPHETEDFLMTFTHLFDIGYTFRQTDLDLLPVPLGEYSSTDLTVLAKGPDVEAAQTSLFQTALFFVMNKDLTHKLRVMFPRYGK